MVFFLRLLCLFTYDDFNSTLVVLYGGGHIMIAVYCCPCFLTNVRKTHNPKRLIKGVFRGFITTMDNGDDTGFSFYDDETGIQQDDIYSNYSSDSDYSVIDAMVSKGKKKRCWPRRRICDSQWFFPCRRSHDGLQTVTHVMTAVSILLISASVISNVLIVKSHNVFHSQLTFNWLVTIIIGNGLMVLLAIMSCGISSMLWWKTSSCYHYSFLGSFDEYETLYDNSQEFMRREFDASWAAGNDISSTRANDEDFEEEYGDRVTTFSQVPPSNVFGYLTDTQASTESPLVKSDLEGCDVQDDNFEAIIAASYKSAEVKQLAEQSRRRAIMTWRRNYQKLLINYELKAQLHKQWASMQRYPFMMCCMVTSVDEDGLYE